MSKAVQHTFALTQFLNRQTIVFLIQEKSGFLAIHYIHHITNAIFRNFHVCIKFCSNETFYPAQTFFFPLLRITTLINTSNLNAGIAGASEVTGLDISEFAVEQATENAKRNSLSDTVTFRAANVLDELPKLAAAGEKYDVVILDPPAFTKSRQATKNAIKGYREINMKGLKLVKDGGYLATCSCSHFMTQELLAKTIREAARATHKRLRQVEFRTQAADHPILWAAEESYYLKFFIFQVVDEK